MLISTSNVGWRKFAGSSDVGDSEYIQLSFESSSMKRQLSSDETLFWFTLRNGPQHHNLETANRG
jgi:hypothetical protein